MLGIIVGTPLYIFRDTLRFFDQVAPTVELPGAPKAIGANPTTLKIHVADTGAGLDEVVVRMGQKELIRKAYSGTKSSSDVVELTLDAKTLGVRADHFSIDIKVFDKSFFQNEATTTASFQIDTIRPKVEVVTVQNNGSVGGVLMTFYRLRSDDVVKSGVKVGNTLTEGYPATTLDPAFSADPNLYFALYPIPTTFDPKTERLAVYAEDAAGNFVSVPFYNKVQPKVFRKEDMKMPKEFFISKVSELLPLYLKAAGEPPSNANPEDLTDAELAEDFKKINEKYRAILEGQIKELSKKSVHEKLWEGVFERALPAKPTATFAEQRSYSVNGVSAGGSTHFGVDLAQTANATVRAANKGRVMLAEEFGIYGNALIIDHGFGLISLYGHLSSSLVNVGDTVNKGEQIGQTGATGLAGGDHLHFEIRLQGVPITPFEWLDPGWIRDHIDGPIALAKGALGG